MQELKQSAAATLVAYPQRTAEVSSATVRFQTPSTGLTDAAAATVEDVSLLLTAAADMGDTLLSVDAFGDADAPVIGRQYLIVERGQETLRVEIADFSSAANTVRLAQPLTRDVAIGGELKGFALTTSLTSTHTETKGHGIAEWTVTHLEADQLTSTVAVPFSTTFRIVERSTAHSLTWSRLTTYAPHLQNELPTNDTTGEETLRAAWLQHVKPAFAARDMLVERILDPSSLEPVHVAAVDFLLHPRDELVRDEFYAKVEQAVSARGFWPDDAEDLTPPDDVAQPRRLSLTR